MGQQQQRYAQGIYRGLLLKPSLTKVDAPVDFKTFVCIWPVDVKSHYFCAHEGNPDRHYSRR